MKYIIAVLSFIIIGFCIVYSIPLYYGFALAALINIIYHHLVEKHPIKLLFYYYYQGIKEHRVIFMIILLIGGIVSIWIASGIVPALIYYGFSLISKHYIYTISFVFCSVIGVFMGTALGIITTVGIALMGIGAGYDVNMSVLLGAIISGAFIADKLSPISGLHNLLLIVTETRYKNVFKEMMKTFIPVYSLSLIFFIYFDLNKVVQLGDTNGIQIFKSHLVNYFNITPMLLLVPLIIVILPFFKVDAKYSLLTGLVLGGFVTVFIQDQSLYKTLELILKGFHLEGASPVAMILKSGGMIGMIEVILIVMGALGLVGILNGTKVLDDFSQPIKRSVSSKGNLLLKTALMSSIFTVITCDQTIGIIVPTKIFKNLFEKFKIKREVLTRIISDTGVVIAPLMPWNVNVIIFSKALNLDSMAFIKFAVLCYLFPIITIIMALKKNLEV